MLKKFVVMLTAICLVFSFIGTYSASAETLGENEISAPAAILMDYETGKVLYEKNSHEVRPCASITKVMTLCLIFEAIESGKLNYDTTVTASPHAASMGGSDIWLVEGEQMSANDMIKAIVVASANDAAVAMAEQVSGSEDAFVAEMNKKAQSLGMKETVFKNCNGLDEDGHVTSAYDVALMSRELMTHKDIFNYTSIWLDYLRDGSTQIVNTNKLLKSYDGITGLKTGTTSAAGACISATAQRGDLSLISVILGAESTTNRFSDAATLLNYGFANYTCVTPKDPDEPLLPIKVKNGMNSEVNLKYSLDGKFLTEKGSESNIASEVKVKEEIEAPVQKGQEVGRITYKLGETVIGEFPVVADGDVAKINFKDVLSLLFDALVGV